MEIWTWISIAVAAVLIVTKIVFEIKKGIDIKMLIAYALYIGGAVLIFYVYSVATESIESGFVKFMLGAFSVILYYLWFGWICKKFD